MDLTHYIVYAWLAIGFIFSLIATAVFRKDGTAKPQELYLSIIAPLLGPIVALLLTIDLIKLAIKKINKKRIPEFASVGKDGTAMKYCGNMIYWREAGQWGLMVKLDEKGRLVGDECIDSIYCQDQEGNGMTHLKGKPMVKISMEKYREDNEGYLSLPLGEREKIQASVEKVSFIDEDEDEDDIPF